MSDFLADAILVLHALLVLFILGALPVIWVGYFRRWRFVRNFYFRMAHLLLIGIVAAESVFGVWCPLTTWEDSLRSRATYDNGFIAYWVHKLLFYDFPVWVFTTAYVVFFILVAAAFYFVPPEFPRSRKPASAPRP
jgi:hypothetical protein